MKTSNAKNLRREVKRQLKELRGRVGQMAVGELKIENGELKINSTDCEDIVDAMINDERLTLNEEGAVRCEMCDRHPTTGGVGRQMSYILIVTDDYRHLD